MALKELYRARTENGSDYDDVLVHETGPGKFAAYQRGVRVSAEFGDIERAKNLADSFAEDWDDENQAGG